MSGWGKWNLCSSDLARMRIGKSASRLRSVVGLLVPFLFVGLVGLFERIWPEEEGVRFLSAFKLWIDARGWKMTFAF